MKKFIRTIGKKNLIIITGILLIGVAIYLNLKLTFPGEDEFDSMPGGNVLENNYDFGQDDDSKVLGQAALVSNTNLDGGNAAPELLDADGKDDNYFAVSVVNRQRARDESLELLQGIVEGADNESDIKTQALNGIQAIALDIEREANIETLIKAKGFEDCVAVVDGDIASVIVKTDGLMDNEIAQIKEIVYEQANILPKNVKIIEK